MAEFNRVTLLQIWVDADACPAPVRDIVVRAAAKRAILATFVANKPLQLPQSPYITSIQVSLGPDVVDEYIVEHAAAADLVVTQDIPLAARLVQREIVVITPRGDLYTLNNINEALAQRDLMQGLRDTGTVMTSQRAYDDRLKRQFANHFDAELNRLVRNAK
ncbi:MAG TPA: YaiI/YqxD family protein [Planktothrix sp.]